MTPLHTAVGATSSDLTIDLVRSAVEVHAEEGQRLDFKRELAPRKGMGQTDLPKDVASFANAEGGMLVYGVTDKNSGADELKGVKEFDELYERSIRSAVLNDIHPSVHNVVIRHLQDDTGLSVVTVEVPRSPGAPHFVGDGNEGGHRAPLRVGRDTRWLTESEIAEAYRRRFSGQREAQQALEELYAQTYAPGRSSGRAWLVAVARPVIAPWRQPRRDRDRARELVTDAVNNVRAHVHQDYYGALGAVDFNVRPTLRGWTAPPSSSPTWHLAYVSIFDDGSVAVSMSVGGRRGQSGDMDDAHEMEAEVLESGVADLGALMHRLATEDSIEAYDVRVGVEYESNVRSDMQVWGRENHNYRWDTGVRLPRFTPVQATVTITDDLAPQIADLALDLVNQGGVSVTRVVNTDYPWA